MSRVLIIAEAGVNHNGDLAKALALCEEAKRAGADIVKFQTWKTEKLITKTTALAEYQAQNTGENVSQFEMLKQLELDFESFGVIQAHCRNIGIEFLSTPDDEVSLDYLVDDLGLAIVKVGSGEVTNLPYLRKIGAKGKPIILSTGMSNLGEVEMAIGTLQKSGAGPIQLLHCTTNYPCPMAEVNLRAMDTLAAAFGLPVGYSDHTLGIEVPIAAVARGATILEKHFTLNRQLPGPDHASSLEPQELAQMVSLVRNIEIALGDGMKRPNRSEELIKSSIQRSIVASQAIRSGDVFSEANVTVKRAGGGGIPAALWDSVIGRTANRHYSPDELVQL